MYNVAVLLIFIISLSGVSNVTGDQSRTWSFELVDLSIPDALSKISHESGIDIFLEGDTNNMAITKSYNNITLDNVFMDMLSDLSFIVLFSYTDRNISRINVWVIPEASAMNRNMHAPDPSPKTENTVGKPVTNHGQLQKIVHTPVLSGTINETAGNRNNTSVQKSSTVNTSLPVRQASGVIQHSGRSITQKKEPFSDHDRIIDTQDNFNNSAPYEQKQIGGLEPPPMPPVMIQLEEK